MTATGWTAEPPDAAPALPVSGLLLSNGRAERQPGQELEAALARSQANDAREAREAAAAAPDPDERAAGLIVKGVMPGMIGSLAQRHSDTVAELETERALIAKGERVTARVRGMLERGQIGGLEAHQAMSGDFGDAERAAKLERQIARLDAQITEAAAMIAPPQPERDPDPVAAAGRRAHDVFAEATRAMMAGERPVPSERRQKGYVSRGASTEHTGADCWVCAAGRQRDAERAAGAAGERKLPPPTEFNGPSLTRAVGEDDDGRIGNYAPMIYR